MFFHANLKKNKKNYKVLDEIEVAVKILNQQSNIENPIDRNYDQLKCNLEPLEHSDMMFKLIEEYLVKNHAPTHSNYKLKLLNVFKARKEAEETRFKDYGNRMLLWHGSR
jgi:hypothetical protein